MAPTFLLNAVSYLAVIAALLAMDVDLLRREMMVPRARRQVREGLRYAWQTPFVRAPLLLTLVVCTLSQNFRIVLPLMATTVFTGGAQLYGTLMAMLGLGALAGALACAHYAQPTQRLLLGTAAGFGLVSLVGAAPSLLALAVVMVAVGAGHTAFNTTSNALVQLRSATPMRGRVLALRSILTLGTTPLGAPLIGWVCEVFGARTGMALGGAAALLAALVAVPTRHLDAEFAAGEGPDWPPPYVEDP